MGIALSASALSWHGVLLSEAARLAPGGMRGFVTGGVLSFGPFGGLLLPLASAGALGAGPGMASASCWPGCPAPPSP